MATFFRSLAAALFLVLFSSAGVRADNIQITPTYMLSGVITIVGQGADPPTQTVDVSFDFALFEPPGFTDDYFPEIMPGVDSYTTFGVLGSSSGGIADFNVGILSYSPIDVGGAEIDITDDSYVADPFHSIGADLYSCYGNTTCTQDFPFVEYTSYPISFTYTLRQVPESSTLLLIFTGLPILLWVASRRSLACSR